MKSEAPFYAMFSFSMFISLVTGPHMPLITYILGVWPKAVCSDTRCCGHETGHAVPLWSLRFSKSLNSVALKRWGSSSGCLSSLSKHVERVSFRTRVVGVGGTSWEGCDTWRQHSAEDVGRMQLPELSRSASRDWATVQNPIPCAMNQWASCIFLLLPMWQPKPMDVYPQVTVQYFLSQSAAATWLSTLSQTVPFQRMSCKRYWKMCRWNCRFNAWPYRRLGGRIKASRVLNFSTQRIYRRNRAVIAKSSQFTPDNKPLLTTG
jgi:hypothetical protein